ncbi:MAG: peptidylprolyl isomerase [Planctomycetota bacterium]|nr:peptidylprolyl isomerase [Planctomycetota bacterium]
MRTLLIAGLILAGSHVVAQDAEPLSKKAPAKFQVKLETSKGTVIIQVTRDWSPVGADRIHELVNAGFYDDCRFFRVIKNFMAQVGINGDPKVHAKWKDKTIKDDIRKKSNKRGFVSFAKSSAPDSRSTQFFISYKDNAYLDSYGFSPFGEVVEGMDVVDKLYNGYGDGAPNGNGPPQFRVVREGNVYLKEKYPNLDFIKKATIVVDKPKVE